MIGNFWLNSHIYLVPINILCASESINNHSTIILMITSLILDGTVFIEVGCMVLASTTANDPSTNLLYVYIFVPIGVLLLFLLMILVTVVLLTYGRKKKSSSPEYVDK